MTEIEKPPADALVPGPGHGIPPTAEDPQQPDQDPHLEQYEPTGPDGQTTDPAVNDEQGTSHVNVLTRVRATTQLTVTAVLNEARSHLGFREGRNNDNPFWQWPPYYTWLRYASYCASAATYCFWRAGGQGGLSAIYGGHYNCAEWVSTARAHGRFYSRGQRGDLVLYDWSGRKSYAEHVGIVEGVDVFGNVTAIEFNTLSGQGGNQSDGGGCYRRTRGPWCIVGYARPVYGGEINVGPVPSSHGKIVLAVDGAWGAHTTQRLQQYMGISQDGQIGPNTRKALQRLVGATQDGAWGPATRRALQKLLRVTQDGAWGPITIKAFQRYLNGASTVRGAKLIDRLTSLLDRGDGDSAA